MTAALAERQTELQELEDDWLLWLVHFFIGHMMNKSGDLVAPASHHCDFWEWLWAIQRGQRPRPFVAIWPRGGAKSTLAEMGCVALGARGIRRYGLYVCETQDQADDHIETLAGLLESPVLEAYYPRLASRMLGKYGTSKGWRRNRLRTAAGFTMDAIGLDSAARGVKLDADRPDLMIFDDIDGGLDGPTIVDRKIKLLTRKLLPAGAEDLAVLAVQNLVHGDSLFARMADGRADWLVDRIVSGPIPALQDFAWEWRQDGATGHPRAVIVSGTPTWLGMDREHCQELINDEGISAFQAERQHDVEAPPGGMFDHLEFQHVHREGVPPLERIVVWVDPAVTESDSSDSHGIQADGLGIDGRIYRLYSWEGKTTPQDVIRRGLQKAVELQAEALGVETDQGGGTWLSVCREAWRELVEERDVPRSSRVPEFREAKAGAGHGPKRHRAQQMLTDYEAGLVIHVTGTHETLEKALRRFPKTKPYDLVDACYWSWADLRADVGTPMIVRWK